MKDKQKGKATERQNDRTTVSYRKRVGNRGCDEPVKTKSAKKPREPGQKKERLKKFTRLCTNLISLW